MGNFRKFVEISSNWEPPSDYGVPDWDKPGGVNRVWKYLKLPPVSRLGPEFRDINHIKKVIEEKVKQSGGSEGEVSVWGWDGAFFRNVFSVPSNKATMPFIGKVMEFWQSKGANPYPCEAVFVSRRGIKEVELIRLNGRDMSGRGITFEHESFNDNPSNDQRFSRKLPEMLKKIQ